MERYKIKNEEELEELINILASSIGGLINPNKLVNTKDEEGKSQRKQLEVDFVCTEGPIKRYQDEFRTIPKSLPRSFQNNFKCLFFKRLYQIDEILK